MSAKTIRYTMQMTRVQKPKFQGEQIDDILPFVEQESEIFQEEDVFSWENTYVS